MKKLALILVCTFSWCSVFSQLGFHLSPTTYSQVGSTSYQKVETRLSYDAGFFYNLNIADNVLFSFGASMFDRVVETNYNLKPAKVTDQFCNVMLQFTYLKPYPNQKTSFVMGLGISPSLSYKQKILFADGSPTIKNFDRKWYNYCKFGLLANIGISHKISNNTAVFATLSSQLEFKDLVVTKSDVPNFFYRSFSMNFGVVYSFGE